MKIRVATPLPNMLDALIITEDSIKKMAGTFPEHQFERVEIHGPIIANNRNMLVKYNGLDFDKILFLDGDVTFSPKDFETLLKADEPVITGVYQLQASETYNSAWTYGSDYAKIYPDLDGRIWDVECSGLGFMLVDKEVFTKIDMTLFTPYFYYPWCRKLNKFLGEDIGFCWTVEQLGYKVKVHTGVKALHWKRDIDK